MVSAVKSEITISGLRVAQNIRRKNTRKLYFTRILLIKKPADVYLDEIDISGRVHNIHIKFVTWLPEKATANARPPKLLPVDKFCYHA